MRADITLGCLIAQGKMSVKSRGLGAVSKMIDPELNLQSEKCNLNKLVNQLQRNNGHSGLPPVVALLTIQRSHAH